MKNNFCTNRRGTLTNMVLKYIILLNVVAWPDLHQLIWSKPNLSLSTSLFLVVVSTQWKSNEKGILLDKHFFIPSLGFSAKLLFHQAFVHFSADGCFNRGSRELVMVGWMGWGYTESLFTWAKEINASLAVGEVCGSMEGFKKPLWKINVPYMLLMAVWLQNKENDREHLFIVKNYSSHSLFLSFNHLVFLFPPHCSLC